jgi:hypothetical protein
MNLLEKEVEVNNLIPLFKEENLHLQAAKLNLEIFLTVLI